MIAYNLTHLHVVKDMIQAPSFWYDSPGILSKVLSPLATCYAWGSKIFHVLSDPYKANIPVICIGNFTVGGTGKTPMVIAIGQYLEKKGYKVHVISRGYKGNFTGPIRVDPLLHNAKDVGDEPLLIAKYLPTWIAKDRAEGALAAQAAHADIIVLDDGLQNTSLYQDLSFAVVDSKRLIGNGYVLPAGPLREPISKGLNRAHAIIMMGDTPYDSTIFESYPILNIHITPCPKQDIDLKTTAWLAFAGIGFPDKFFKLLQDKGAKIKKSVSFPDHYRYRKKDLATLFAEADKAKAKLITTEKDWVRLPDEWQDKVTPYKIKAAFDDTQHLEKVLNETVFKKSL